jgi:hypothetical protein
VAAAKGDALPGVQAHGANQPQLLRCSLQVPCSPLSQTANGDSATNSAAVRDMRLCSSLTAAEHASTWLGRSWPKPHPGWTAVGCTQCALVMHAWICVTSVLDPILDMPTTSVQGTCWREGTSQVIYGPQRRRWLHGGMDVHQTLLLVAEHGCACVAMLLLAIRGCSCMHTWLASFPGSERGSEVGDASARLALVALLSTRGRNGGCTEAPRRWQGDTDKYTSPPNCKQHTAHATCGFPIDLLQPGNDAELSQHMHSYSCGDTAPGKCLEVVHSEGGQWRTAVMLS